MDRWTQQQKVVAPASSLQRLSHVSTLNSPESSFLQGKINVLRIVYIALHSLFLLLFTFNSKQIVVSTHIALQPAFTSLCMLSFHQLSLKSQLSSVITASQKPSLVLCLHWILMVSYPDPLYRQYTDSHHLLTVLANHNSQLYSSLENFLQPNGSHFFYRAEYSKFQQSYSSNPSHHLNLGIKFHWNTEVLCLTHCLPHYNCRAVAADTKQPKKHKTFTTQAFTKKVS